MTQPAPSERRLQPATIALALAALIAVGVIAYTLGARQSQGGAVTEANASVAATVAFASVTVPLSPRRTPSV